jgi:exodeoxyribonuclease X
MSFGIIADTETTGLKTNEVIELAFMPVKDSVDGIVVNTDAAELYQFKPESEIQYGAMAVHHILPSDLKKKPASAEAIKHIPNVEYIIGHNIDYDIKALEISDIKAIDTLAFCRELWPDCDSHSQSAMMYYLEGTTEKVRGDLADAHNALADIGFCATILQHILAVTCITSLEELWEESERARVPSIMPFGKYRGQPVASVDYGWARWYAKQENTDPYILKALRMFHNI